MSKAPAAPGVYNAGGQAACARVKWRGRSDTWSRDKLGGDVEQLALVHLVLVVDDSQHLHCAALLLLASNEQLVKNNVCLSIVHDCVSTRLSRKGELGENTVTNPGEVVDEVELCHRTKVLVQDVHCRQKCEHTVAQQGGGMWKRKTNRICG